MTPTRLAPLLALLVACGGSNEPRSSNNPPSSNNEPPPGGGEPRIGPVSGFTAAQHGFPFQNYTNMGVTNLTPVEMRLIYGDQVCARIEGATCVLKPVAKQWMDHVSAAMNVGHCEGMAVLSLLLFHGIHTTDIYGGGDISQLSLSGNIRLQRDIARYFAFQIPLAMQRVPGTPLEQVERLRGMFQPGATENYTIAFFKPGFKGGHAVTPTGIVDNGDGTVSIQVYDNNFPAQDRAIIVDSGSQEWRYEAAQTPGNPASLYVGDASTNTLLLVPLSARLATQPCSFCGNVATPSSMSRTVATTGQADILVTDESGARLGDVQGTFVNEITGARVVPLVSDDLWADDQDPFYELPAGSAFEIEVSGRDLEAAEPTSITLAGPGYLLSVDDIVLDPGQVDFVAFGRDTPALEYETDAAETAEAVLAIETAAADWAFALRSRGDSAGQALFAEVDFANGELVFGFDGEDADSEFDLYIERVDDGGAIEFLHEGIVVPNGAVLVVPYAAFDEDGEALELLVDVDDDGNIDDTLSLSDDPG